LKYLVTGGAGFVGSHLVDQLVIRGDSVIILDDFSTGRHENISHFVGNPQISIIEGSILDFPLMENLVGACDRVFHLAAAVGVFNIVRHPLESLTTNIKGSENVFEACLKHNKPVLITSSSEVYGKNTSDRLHENSDRVVGAPQKIRWSYSDAKAIDESIAISLHDFKGLETRIVRLFNTVGPRQTGEYGMVLPRFVESALQNRVITIYGSGNQTRCFGHVKDIVDAILRVDKNRTAIGQPINVGVSDEISILDLAKRVIKISGSQSVIEFRTPSEIYGMRFEDMERRVPDTSLLGTLTGWKPTKTIDDIIMDIIGDLSKNSLS